MPQAKRKRNPADMPLIRLANINNALAENCLPGSETAVKSGISRQIIFSES